MLPENGRLQGMRRQNWTMRRRESGGGVGKPVTWAGPIAAGSLVAAVVSNPGGGRGEGGVGGKHVCGYSLGRKMHLESAEL